MTSELAAGSAGRESARRGQRVRIIVRDGSYEAERDIQPDGKDLWNGGEEQLPAAVLVAMTDRFEPGTWYAIEEFEDIVRHMRPVEEALEVTGTVAAEQSGVMSRWSAAIEVGQSKAAHMVCSSVMRHALRLRRGRPVWIRVD